MNRLTPVFFDKDHKIQHHNGTSEPSRRMHFGGSRRWIAATADKDAQASGQRWGAQPRTPSKSSARPPGLVVAPRPFGGSQTRNLFRSLRAGGSCAKRTTGCHLLTCLESRPSAIGETPAVQAERGTGRGCLCRGFCFQFVQVLRASATCTTRLHEALAN